MFVSDEGPTLETLDFTIRIGSTPTFLHFDLYLNTAYAAHYFTKCLSLYSTCLSVFRNQRKNTRSEHIYIYLCSQWFREATVRLTNLALHKTNDRVRKVQLSGTCDNVVFFKIVLNHELCQVANNFG